MTKYSSKKNALLKNHKVLFWLCAISLALPNFFLFFTERMPLVARLCNIILPFSAFWLAMTASRRPGKTFLWMFLFVFFNAFQMVLLYLFGNSVIAVDMFLNLVTTNPTEAGELLSNIIISVVFVVAVYVPLILWSIYSLRQKPINASFLKKQRFNSLLGCGIGIILLAVSYITNSSYKIQNDLYPVNVIYNIGLAVERTYQTNNYYETSKDFTFSAKSTHRCSEKEIYVLVIGETARAENFGFYGYKRNTTPLLGSMSDLIVFHDALSQSNTTHKSVPMLLSAVSATDFDSIYHQKGIITAFNEAGFSSAFFSNQRHNHSFIDFFGEEAHNHIFIKDDLNENANVYDDALLKLLKQHLDNDSSYHKFIVLHTYGSHFNYAERYPSSKSRYKPDKTDAAKPENRDILINAYDNTIRFTDDFLYRLIKMVNSYDASSCVLYTSDHGEDIFDDERNQFLHASPLPTMHQVKVPFMVWTSSQYDTAHPMKRKALQANTSKPVSSNLAVFHTMLDIAGIETAYRNLNHSLASSDYIPPQPRLYLTDHNTPIAIDEIIKHY